MIILEADATTIASNMPLARSQFSVSKLAVQVSRLENNEPLVDQAEIEKHGIVCQAFWDTPGDVEGDAYQNYIQKHPDFSLSVREGVLKRVVHAQSLLPPNWQIILKAGFRPVTVQRELFTDVLDETKDDHPRWGDKHALEYTRTYVADPSSGCPPHETGGALDLDILDKSISKPVDMGCPPNTNDETAYLHSDQVSPKQRMNRLTLLLAMMEAGFAPLSSEWWHYQYGEAEWAAFYGEERTKYDVIKL